jgi:two-component system, cell cycle sensor histidine kinase and response regulator CckA
MSDPDPSATQPAKGAPPPAPAPGDELLQALLKADRSQSLAPLVAGLATEMNELLTRIQGAVILARDGSPEGNLSDAERSCAAARELTRRMLSLLEEGTGALAPVAPAEILREASRTATAGSFVELVLSVPEGVDPVRVDRAQMVQVFQALVRNSLDALSPPPQRPRIQLRAANASVAEGQVSGLPAGDYVEFEVRDNGSGILPENMERIWEPYFTTRRHGTGLGLPTAVAVVRRHGGQIGVDSTPGVGTVFTVFLPAVTRRDDVRARPAASQRFRTGRILVMDDDERIRAILGAMLQKLDYRADTARDGEDALAQYRRYLDVGRPYDAVILDLGVAGGMGGEEAFRRIREIDPDARGIASGSGHPGETAERCLAQGFSGFLPRPFRPDDLGKALGTVLSG